MSHYDDEQQAEALQQWFKENWMALAGGLVIGLGSIFGWQAWQSAQQNQAAEASRLYEQARTALENEQADKAQGLADKLRSDYAGTPYHAQVLLLQARYEVDAGAFEAAAAKLAEVADGKADEPLRQVARLRLARVLWQLDRVDEALAQLDEGAAGEFASLFEELRGDIKLTQGDRVAAREAYQRAVEAGSLEAANRELLQQKLDSLSDVVSS